MASQLIKTLIVTNNPERASYRQRIGVYLRHLDAAGIACELAVLPRGTWARRTLLARSAQFDAVLLHKKKLNPWDAFWLGRYKRRLIYTYDDAIWVNPRRPERFSPSHYYPFRRTVRLADRVIVGSEYLADQARPLNHDVHVLPLGLEVARYNPPVTRPDDGRLRLVWIGSAATLDYLRALTPCLEEIGRRHPQAVLRIIGDAFFDLDDLPVEKIMWNRDGRYTALAECDIGLAPLPDNPFTRGKCSFKVLEYSAAGLAVVASPVGTNVEHILPDETGYLADGPEAWVERLDALIRDESLRHRLGRRGREHAQRYDVSVIGGRLAELIRGCVESDA